MDKFLDEINYDELIEKSLRNVVYLALKIVEEQGLPGESHFYISFKTDFPGTIISQNLKVQYPETMTIVLQNQFSNLVVRHNSFSVDLSFGGIEQTITIPFDAITYFADPSAKFGLSFEPEESAFASAEGDNASAEDKPLATNNKNAEIISFDKILRKK
jgi:hypothetical protein